VFEGLHQLLCVCLFVCLFALVGLVKKKKKKKKTKTKIDHFYPKELDGRELGRLP